MSHRLLELVGSYRDMMDDKQTSEKLIGLAAMAWNIAIQPENDREAAFTSLSEMLGDGMDRQDLRSIFSELIARKERLFPEDLRYVMKFDVRFKNGNLHLSVASTKLASSS